MSFPLPRLPLLAISEVIKSMDTRGMLYLSVLSKKSQNLVVLSIPKNALSADFTFKEDGFLFELMLKGFMRRAADIIPEIGYIAENESETTRFSTCGRYIQCEWTGSSAVEESIRKLFHRFSKILKKSKIYMKFEDGTREQCAMNMLRFAWENDFPLDSIGFYLKYASPESVQELLNGCNEQHTSLYIRTKFPDGFKYTPPPGGYKFESLSIDNAHWVDLNDFLQCRNLFLKIGFPDWTVESLNGLLKKIVNLECRLDTFHFQLKSLKPSDFPEIVEGLSESAIKLQGAWQGLQFKRKDGLKLLVSLFNGFFSLQADYL